MIKLIRPTLFLLAVGSILLLSDLGNRSNQKQEEEFSRMAREVCQDLGIELLEKSIESVSQVYESALSLGMAQVEALWIGGDNVVEPAIGAYCAAAAKISIPVFFNTPEHAFSGTLLSLGANYYQIGQNTANMVNEILAGRLEPSGVEIKNIVPQKMFVNDSIRRTLRDQWIIPENLSARIDTLIQ
jgi:putative ABC transport system substrate-binding protein